MKWTDSHPRFVIQMSLGIILIMIINSLCADPMTFTAWNYTK